MTKYLKSFYLLILFLLLTSVQQASAELDFEPDPTDRATWYDDAKYGMFIHWGLYSHLARGEWVMLREKIPLDDYKQLANGFNPVKFDADAWVLLAKNAGMKYITITSKHHDGFALFELEVSDFNMVDATPYGRDIIKELKEACDRHGIKLGLYYSQAQDWYHLGGINARRSWDEGQRGGDLDTYLEELSIPQVKEIVTKYDPFLVWFGLIHLLDSTLIARGCFPIRFARFALARSSIVEFDLMAELPPS